MSHRVHVDGPPGVHLGIATLGVRAVCAGREQRALGNLVAVFETRVR